MSLNTLWVWNHCQWVVRRGGLRAGNGFLLSDLLDKEQSPRQSVRLQHSGWVGRRGDRRPVGSAVWLEPREPPPRCKGRAGQGDPGWGPEQGQERNSIRMVPAHCFRRVRVPPNSELTTASNKGHWWDSVDQHSPPYSRPILWSLSSLCETRNMMSFLLYLLYVWTIPFKISPIYPPRYPGFVCLFVCFFYE